MIKRYTHAEHFELLKAWNDARGQHGLERWMLPDVGFVFEKKAIAFLVTTNSPVALIRHWAVDPSLSREARSLAFEALAEKLERIAKLKGFRLVETLGKQGHSLSSTLQTSGGYLTAPGAFTFLVKDVRS